ncbi:MAG TPA: FAD-dependent monooxygenase [Stellaceae bacterium]|nr:FAD-dependent monooxygenase [Stellaceae bacterium]
MTAARRPLEDPRPLNPSRIQRSPRPITSNWGRDRVQLIGDAAHAMLPNAGQGACQAFEDAYILGHWMAAEPEPQTAFAQFRRTRIPRVHAVQQISIVNGKFKHMQDGAAQKAMIASGKGSVQGYRNFLWLYDPIKDWDKEPMVPVIEGLGA